MKYFTSIFIITLFFASCQPKANITTIEDPMNAFTPVIADSSPRGANTAQDLACYLFLALKQKITYNDLAHFIPDSADIVKIYQLTKTDLNGANVKANADSVYHQLQRDLLNTESEAGSLHATWIDATFDKVLLMEIEDQKLPSKKIMMQCKADGTTLLASCKCLKIGDRWFIGEDLKFGM